MNTHRKSNLYAVAQFVLIAAFAGVFFLKPGPAVFVSMTTAGNILCVAGLVLMAAAFVSLRKVIQVAPEPTEFGAVSVTLFALSVR